MIFKYFAYDKKTKDWLDTKLYCTVCMPINKKIQALTPLFYDALIAQKIISIPAVYFSLNDSSTFPGVKTFTLSHLTPSRRTYIGKLTQLPNKDNATDNAKIKESWNHTLTFTAPKVRAIGDNAWREVPASIWDQPIRVIPAWGQEIAEPEPINPPEAANPIEFVAVQNNIRGRLRDYVEPFINENINWDDGAYLD